MKVNMTPNPLDVVTIHASQGDSEARQWEFELHNNGELIDTSDVTEQMFFKAYKGGTEQLLPENTSTPTTSPFLGDIRYPQGLLSDQEFTYRQSPTEEDGLAKITDIKGNTLLWNQLVKNSQQTATVSGVTFTNNGDNSWNISGTATTDINFNLNTRRFALDKQGIYFISGCPSGGSYSTYSFGVGGLKNDLGDGAIWENTPNYTTGTPTFLITNGVAVNFTDVKFIICNLTQMFGATKAKEIYAMEQAQSGSGIAYFRSLYPLPYYQYDSGSLLPFRGEGLKTVGFNQWDEEWELGTYLNVNGSKYNSTSKIRNVNPIRVLPNTSYYYIVGTTSTDEDGVFFYDGNMNFIRRQPIYHGSSVSTSFTTPANCSYVNFSVNNTTYNNDICINISNTELNGTYEPYTSSTLSLPISTYFPTGMKSAVSVYDELTPMKAITRIGSIDMGTLEWESNNPSANIFMALIDIKEPSDYEARKTGFINPKYLPSSGYAVSPSMDDKSMLRLAGHIFIRDTAFSDAQALKTSLNGVYLYYELATPTETSFTTASLVTENGEIPLSNDDGVLIGKCTEELSENPGFIDAKIKLSDADGECYSNKLQLHVERSPQ